LIARVETLDAPDETSLGSIGAKVARVSKQQKLTDQTFSNPESFEMNQNGELLPSKKLRVIFPARSIEHSALSS
jgi:hypothetical protein